MSSAPETTPHKITSLADLQAIKQKVNQATVLRADGYTVCVTVHLGTCGVASGAREVLGAMLEELAGTDRQDVRITSSGCVGACYSEPVATIETLEGGSVMYGNLDADKAREVFRTHVMEGKVLPKYVVTYPDEPTAQGR
jgi:NADP-reducing hydrogenase subunit HndB